MAPLCRLIFMQWEEEGEEKLVVFVEPPARVMKDLKGQGVNDVLDLLVWDGVRVQVQVVSG